MKEKSIVKKEAEPGRGSAWGYWRRCRRWRGSRLEGGQRHDAKADPVAEAVALQPNLLGLAAKDNREGEDDLVQLVGTDAIDLEPDIVPAVIGVGPLDDGGALPLELGHRVTIQTRLLGLGETTHVEAREMLRLANAGKEVEAHAPPLGDVLREAVKNHGVHAGLQHKMFVKRSVRKTKNNSTF